jgi:hypothetical protein
LDGRRDRLLRANTEAFELEMARQARMAMFEAIQKHQKQKGGEAGDDEKFERMAERIGRELGEEEKRLAELGETRQKVETAIRRGEQNLHSLETRMR